MSFEHVPPAAAYNRFPRFRPEIREYLAHRYEGAVPPNWVEERRGAGAYTLCDDCNNKRCGRYAARFVQWAVAWQSAIDSDPTARFIQLTQRIYRTRVLKQVVAMFLSANPPKTGDTNPGLRRFVWSTEVTDLPKDIRVFAALTRDQIARQAGVGGKFNTDSGHGSIYSEIAFAPLIQVMTFAGSAPPDSRLVDITFMAAASYNSIETTTLHLPVLSLHDFYPGAYQ